LRVARKPDSHDICFIADGDTAGFLRDRLGEQPGPVIDETGERVGEHTGAYAFTVGQRRGLNLGTPAPDGRPRYVLSIEPATATVTVGPREHLAATTITADDPRWLGPIPEAGCGQRFDVQWRAHGVPVAATVVVGARGVEIALDEPAYGIAAGQEVVLYAGTQVFASARINGAA
jgi:tRNA-specific 2-thiouridylase